VKGLVKSSTSNTQLLGSIFEATKQQNIDITQFIKTLGGTHKLISLGDIAWSGSDLIKLNNGQAIVLSDSSVTEQIYILDNTPMLIEVSLPINRPDSGKFLLYSIIFFLPLSGVIVFWFWPI
jgi:hypothetical protein